MVDYATVQARLLKVKNSLRSQNANAFVLKHPSIKQGFQVEFNKNDPYLIRTDGLVDVPHWLRHALKRAVANMNWNHTLYR